MSSDALGARLARLSPSVVSDVLDNCGYPEQSLGSAIRPLSPAMRFAGPAMCFAGIVESPWNTVPALSTYDMDARLTPGCVAVIATGGYAAAAVVGGLMALSFTKRGCAGIVTDGAVRDVAEITALALPAFCASTTPLNSAKRWKLTESGGTVVLPGQVASRIEIRTGDYLIGDADGVMVIPREIAPQVIEWSEQLAAIEERIIVALNAGTPREQAFTANPRFAHIGKLR